MNHDSFDRLKSSIGDRYRIERELGRGGMATVYLALDVKQGRRVAVKVLRPELAYAIGPERFIREIDIAAKLSHPNILPLHESGEADGQFYYVMPYVEGETLRDRLNREHSLPVDEAVHITRNVADALTYAHGHGVIHRDIKPENILLTGGQAVVMDFGIARAIDAAETTRLTETGLAIGTPAYMSPEQASGVRGADGRSDIYSLGCVVYEMLAGEPPFTGPNPQAVMARHAIDPVPPLRTLRPSITQSMERAVEKALAKVPADRFASADQFASQLARASTAEAVATEVRTRSTRRSRWLVVTAAALLLAGAAWVIANLLAHPGIHRLAVLPLRNLSSDSSQEYFTEGMHDALISELAQAGVPVIARTSVMQYVGTTKPIRDIARELGVDAVIEGSLERSGDSVFIRAQLIDGKSQQTLWARSYQGDLRNVIALHRQVARAIVGELRLALTPEAEEHLRTEQEVHPESYEAYLKGMFHWRRASVQDIETAKRYFESALATDPNSALANAGIALVWVALQQNGLVPRSEATPLARAAAAKALALDSTLSDVHTLLAGLKTWTDWDWEGAESEFQRAIALNPNEPQVRAYYSHFLYIVGRPDAAMPQIHRALELDPQNTLLQDFYAMDLMYAHRYDEAIAAVRPVLNSSPNDLVALATLRSAYHMQGNYTEALKMWRSTFAARGDSAAGEALTRGFSSGGYSGALTSVAELLVTRSRTTPATPWQIGTLYARAGKTQDALDYLERAFDAHDPNVPYLSVDPVFDGLRANPRFQNLIRRLGLPHRPSTSS